jgi:DNA-binding FadR family transcriptional regulator
MRDARRRLVIVVVVATPPTISRTPLTYQPNSRPQDAHFALTNDWQMSPTPVREALRRLEQDRLVQRTGPRSLRVAELEQRTIRELSLIEARLRALAARLAAEHASENDHRAMTRVLAAADEELARIPSGQGRGAHAGAHRTGKPRADPHPD